MSYSLRLKPQNVYPFAPPRSIFLNRSQYPTSHPPDSEVETRQYRVRGFRKGECI